MTPLIKPEDIPKHLGPRATYVTYADMCEAHRRGELDWRYCGLLCFQRAIRERGTEAEKQQLRGLKCGYIG